MCSYRIPRYLLYKYAPCIEAITHQLSRPMMQNDYKWGYSFPALCGSLQWQESEVVNCTEEATIVSKTESLGIIIIHFSFFLVHVLS